MAQQSPRAHPSARLGLLSMILGVVGSAIAYLGLWLESNGVGLIGFSLVGVAVVGAVASLVWNVLWSIGRRFSGKRR